MTAFFRKLAKSAPVAFNNVFNETPKLSYGIKFLFPIGGIAAVSGGLTSHHQL
ncbi:hypothetical protein MKX01_007528, partial [Papaver californicum]